ncbi:hypothetical protein RvY_05017 [Ramazzottius varieornatus]|uniref:Uncharacterized protein n=1 Tax=Ramazzottius varieornatus TaxID=947166 RepID=A0A1D1V097_RAMVA|nr:hypothetical protein RvY_05017 [Ramazzottius varieornatus]
MDVVRFLCCQNAECADHGSWNGLKKWTKARRHAKQQDDSTRTESFFHPQLALKLNFLPGHRLLHFRHPQHLSESRPEVGVCPRIEPGIYRAVHVAKPSEQLMDRRTDAAGNVPCAKDKLELLSGRRSTSDSIIGTVDASRFPDELQRPKQLVPQEEDVQERCSEATYLTQKSAKYSRLHIRGKIFGWEVLGEYSHCARERIVQIVPPRAISQK